MVELYLHFTICLHDIVHIYIIKQMDNFILLTSFSLTSRNQIDAVLTLNSAFMFITVSRTLNTSALCIWVIVCKFHA
jgi:hypothetical protein